MTSNLTTTEFDGDAYRRITADRLRHFDWLELPIAGKRVLDVGAGIGRLAEHLAARGADVTCIDGRSDNIALLRELYPAFPAHVVDVESDDLSKFGTFDIVFCYGLLYHLTEPLTFLRNMGRICSELAVLETCILDADEPLLKLFSERGGMSQSLADVGCRPSPSYIEMSARLAGFPHVYAPLDTPDHPEFRFDWRNDHQDLRDGRAMRDIFILAKSPLPNHRLLPR